MDDVSNRTSLVETPRVGTPTTTSYTSGSQNQYSAIGGTSRTHDANRNLIDDGTYEYSYDYRNNLVQVMDGATVVLEAEFDAFGRRTKKLEGSGASVVKYYYDGGHGAEERDGSDNLLRSFVYGQRTDEIRVMISPDISDVDDDQNTLEVLAFYFHRNMLGSVSHVTDEWESVVEQYVYLPYGSTTLLDASGVDLCGVSAIGNPYMYTARRADMGSSLYHYRRRAYNPETGRFLQRDPAHLGPRKLERAQVGLSALNVPDPAGGAVGVVNLFEYCDSGPAIHGDPSGLTPKKKCYCGPDVTAWLAKELKVWYDWVSDVCDQIEDWADQDAPWYEPDFVRAKSYRYAFLAIVASQMTYSPTTAFSTANCPSPRCPNTVTVSGICIDVSEVGNLVYGAVAHYFRMTWIQTYFGGIAGNRGARTTADAAAVEIGWDYGGEGGYIGDFLDDLDPGDKGDLGSDAPAECVACPESVNANKNHVVLPPVTPGMNKKPVKVGIPAKVN
jgi:RHS repeat-associated protein